MNRGVFMFSFILVYLHSFGQREFGVCDSTSYTLNPDTTIVAGRHLLYTFSNNTLDTIHDFTSSDPDEYIRDFDVVKPDLWYTVVGLRYIGGPTRLYKSSNRGQTWALDTAHHHATNAEFQSIQFLESINNLQHLNGDTLIMFMHYYESGLLYSTDLGKTWTKWFANLIAHYQGMLECDDKYYIFGYEGDGFRASMFGFDKSLLFTPDSTGLWSSFNHLGYHPACYNGDTINCIYAPHQSNRCESYHYFKNEVDTLCLTLLEENIQPSSYRIYPNPFTTTIIMEGTSGTESYSLANVYGQIVWSDTKIEEQDFSHLTSGIYFLSIIRGNSWHTIKLIKE
jgi:hypothetical protein